MAEVSDFNVVDASNTTRWPEGMSPSSVNNSARADEGIIARFVKDSVETNLTSTGSSNAYVVAANRTLSAYYAGLRVAFKANFANTDAATVNVDSIGAKNIFKRTDSGVAALDGGEIQSGDIVDLIYDGTQFQLLSALPIGAITAGTGLTGGGDLSADQTISLDAAYLRGYLSGLTLSNNSTDSDNDIDIAAGVAVDSTNAKFLKLASGITKRLDASWAVGTNQGGLDGSESSAGTPDTSTWYHVWLIMRSDTGVVDALFSESATSPTMPTGYDYKRRIGAVLTDGDGDIIAFKQTGDWVQWVTSLHDVNDASGHTTSRSLRTLSSPLGLKCRVKFRAYVPDSSSNHSTIFQDPDETDAAPNVTMTPPGAVLGSASGNFAQMAELEVMTNTSSQIASRCSATGKPLDIITVGYVDRRGRDD